MDYQRDSGWIEPLEATALSMDEETKTQTPVSIEGDMNWTGTGTDFSSISAGEDAGAPIMGGLGGVARLPPLSFKTAMAWSPFP